MKHTIYTDIIINAPVEDVWTAFRDFSTHKTWNNFLKIHDDDLTIGQSIKIDFLDGEKIKMSMTPTLLKDDPEKSFEWVGHLLIKGLFDGHHQFHFSQLKDGTTRFIQTENFSGLLIRMLKKSVLDPTEVNFAKMNQALKAYIERQLLVV